MRANPRNPQTNILKILGSVLKLRENFKLSCFLAQFKALLEAQYDQQVDPELINVSQADVESLVSNYSSADVLDVDGLSKSPLDTVLLDLMMYESDELFENALLFMQRRYTETKQLLESLPQLTLIKDSRISVFEDYICLHESLQQLAYYMRSYEGEGGA